VFPRGTARPAQCMHRSDAHTPCRCAVAAVAPALGALAKAVHGWLVKSGHVNFGIAVPLKVPPFPLQPVRVSPPCAPAPAVVALGSASAAVGGCSGEGVEGNPGGANAVGGAPTDAQLLSALHALLRTVDLGVTTERQLRGSLEAQFRCELVDRKALLKASVAAFLAQDAPALLAAQPGAPPVGPSVGPAPVGPTVADLKTVVIVGAGPAGLAAARHLAAQGFAPIVLEARNRSGGRVHTDATALSVPVDFGASIITGVSTDAARPTHLGRGVRCDPSAVVARQWGMRLRALADKMPLYDTATGLPVPQALDAQVEALRDELLDAARATVDRLEGGGGAELGLGQELERVLSLREAKAAAAIAAQPAAIASPAPMAQATLEDPEGDAFARAALSIEDDVEEDVQHAMPPTELAAPAVQVPESEPGVPNGDAPSEAPEAPPALPLAPKPLTAVERRLLDWHWANLEYGCSAPLSSVSLAHWNQDEEFGGFGGDHAMVAGGYQLITAAMSSGLDIRLRSPVSRIEYGARGVRVHVDNGRNEAFEAAAVVITVPLGCLKAQTIAFEPPLPGDKRASIERLGFGSLNKVFLEFDHVFWDGSVDYFGAAREGGRTDRGRCFMFWNLTAVVGAPVLAALLAGDAADASESNSDEQLADMALGVLRTLFPSAPKPVGCTASRWTSDPWSRGSYSYVALGASAADYQTLAAPLAAGRVAFAGEHTCREHPDTVGGAMLTGVRAANAVVAGLTHGRDALAEWDEDVVEWDQGPLPLPDEDDSDEEYEGEEDDEDARRDMKGRVIRRSALNDVGVPWADRAAANEAALDARRSFYLRLASADAAELTKLMGSAPDAPARKGLLRHLLGLPIAALRQWSAAGGLAQLAPWLRAGCASPVQELELALRVLARTPMDLALLTEAGLLGVLTSALPKHADAAVRSLAVNLAAKMHLQQRTGRLLSSGTSAGGQSAAASAAGIGALQAARRAGAFALADQEDEALALVAKRAAAMRALRAAAQPSAPAHWRPKEAARAVGTDDMAPECAAALLPPAAAAAVLAASAAREAAAAAARQAEAAALASGGAALAPVPSFDKFAARERKREHRALKKAREAAAEAAAVSAAASRICVDRDGVTEALPPPDDEAQPCIGALSPHSSKRLRAAVAAHVHACLKPAYAARRISRDQFKQLAQKCTLKVLDGTQLSGGVESAHAFMTGQRKRKIQGLVDAAVAKEEARAGGGAAGGDRSERREKKRKHKSRRERGEGKRPKSVAE